MQLYDRIKNYTIPKLVQHKKIVKYLVSGVLSLCADYGTFMLLYYIFSVSLRISVPAGLITGLIVSFLLNKLWAFEATKQQDHHKLGVQMFLYGALVAWNTIFTYYFVKIALIYGIPASVSKLCAVAMTVCWNYILYKKLIFKQAKSGSDI